MEKEGHSAGSPGAVFRTGFGIPLYAFVILLILNFINFFVLQLHGTSSALIALQLLWVLMLIVMVYVMLSTNYRVKDGVLQVRMVSWSPSAPAEPNWEMLRESDEDAVAAFATPRAQVCLIGRYAQTSTQALYTSGRPTDRTL